jgi:hypothetical protein
VSHPLVGRKVIWAFENAFQGASFEVEFVSQGQLTSKGLGEAEGFYITAPYDMVVIRPDVYFVIYNVSAEYIDDEVISIVIDLGNGTVSASLVTEKVHGQLMIGKVKELQG